MEINNQKKNEDGNEIVPAEVKEEEVRAKVIAEYGFDEVDDLERIEKIVAKEMDLNKKLSAAIGQKIKYRTEAEQAKAEAAKGTKPPVPGNFTPEDIDKKVDEKLEQRDLDSFDYSDEIKKEIKDLAHLKGISVKAAARDPYIVFKIGEYEKVKKAEDAAIGRNHKANGSSKKNYTIDNPPEVDMSTKEGREEWESYKEAMKKQGF